MKKLVGVFATIALLGSGAALAGDDKNKPQQDPSSAQGGAGQAGSESVPQDTGMQDSTIPQDDPATGGSGTTMPSDPAMGGSGTMGSQSAMGQKEITGKVVKADSKTVWLSQADGAVVPLKVDKSTQFGDPNVKRAKDLQPGQEIRASYEVKETDNIAKSISMSGTGGSGAGDVMSPDSSINEGTGGTGMEDDKSLDPGMTPPPSTDPGTGGSGDSTMNPDTQSGSTSGSDVH
ncbi:RNA-binding protein [Pyxidicoccus xibeiensis]|uniref:RNA-binding protein n=1 Tax=Pyxidicoccus xibeiensis TaxID=2906759 RepID=UPI0020A837A4|nr:RNA-binding protein [Pyxidicoccus xibeiensis]MCP3141432.1 RNA-binding protein [Pyxidicoccus xibeiensis]